MRIFSKLFAASFVASAGLVAPAFADCIGDESNAAQTRTVVPRTAPSALVMAAPSNPALVYDYDRTVQDAICGDVRRASEVGSFHFTADISFEQFMQIYWPYASRIFRVDPDYRSFQLTNSTFVRLTCTRPCNSNVGFAQPMRIQISPSATARGRPLVLSTGVDDDWTRETFIRGTRAAVAPAPARIADPQTTTNASNQPSQPSQPTQQVDQANLPLCKKSGSGAVGQAAAGAVASAGWALGGRLGGALWSGGNAANRAAQSQTQQENNQQPGVTCRVQ
jgi:hypothetical protein